MQMFVSRWISAKWSVNWRDIKHSFVAGLAATASKLGFDPDNPSVIPDKFPAWVDMRYAATIGALTFAGYLIFRWVKGPKRETNSVTNKN